MISGFSSLADFFFLELLLADVRRGKKETVYIGMFKAKILIIGPCEVRGIFQLTFLYEVVLKL